MNISYGARPRARMAVALGLATLVAALVPAPAQAAAPSSFVTLKQAFKFDGSKWVETIRGTDFGGSDSVSVSLSKVRQKKNSDGKLVYSLKETQEWYFFGLNENTVEINSNNLGGSIDLGEQLPGVFEADITFGKIEGKTIKKTCNNNVSTAPVEKKAGSTMSLQTENELFGNLTKIPNKGSAMYNNGKCNSSGGHYSCPHPGKAIQGTGSTTGGQSFLWSGTAPNNGPIGQVYVSTSRSLGGNSSYMASIFGKVQKNRINTTDKVLNGGGLPTLSGEGLITDLGPESPSGWTNCGKDKRTRDVLRMGDQGGDLEFTPTGGAGIGAADLDEDFDSGSWRRTEVGNRP